jgi:mRNA-degrading endonuclease RelE of RelBE toxin-antitoxin system
MNFEVRTSSRFVSEIKLLAKKYRSLKREFEELISSLEVDPKQGTPIGKSCYKVRLGIESKGKGKDTLSPNELTGLLKEWNLES